MTRPALVAVAAAVGLLLGSAGPALAAQPYPLNFNTVDFSTGMISGLDDSSGTLTLGSGSLPSFSYVDPHASVPVLGATVDGSGTYSFGTWTSPAYRLSFPFNELVSSWNAKTSPGTWIQSEVLPQLDDGHWASKWYILGRWAYNDSAFHRTSVGGQGNADGFVSIDTFFAKDHPAIAYRLRLTIYRRTGLTAEEAPVSVSRYSAVASNLTNQKGSFPSATTMQGETIDLGVAPYSQELADAVDPYVRVFKIGSGDLTWLELVEYVAAKGKPVLLATGASTLEEVERAVAAILAVNDHLVLLQCNTNYTGATENFRYVNLRVLNTFRQRFPEVPLGLSDHTTGPHAA